MNKLLSVCMIVKDEEAVLSQALESIKSVADEIIIVDTGSTDKTKEIAAKYTEQVYDFEWCNDFAAARNYSIQFAKGQWILIMDADEYLPNHQIHLWRDLLKKENPHKELVYTLMIVNHLDDRKLNHQISTAPVTRLFPNYNGIKFTNPIHEQLVGKNGMLQSKLIELNIFHSGYQQSIIESKKKHERNMYIFNEMQKKGEMSAYDYFTLGNQHAHGGEELKAIECFNIALERGSDTSTWHPFCLMGLITLYIRQDMLDKSWDLIETKLKKFADYPEYFVTRGIHYETLGYFKEAEECYEKGIQCAEKNAKWSREIWLTDPKFAFYLPAYQLVNICFRLNKEERAVYWLTKIIKSNQRDGEALLRLLEWLLHHETIEDILDMLGRTLELKDNYDLNLIYKIALSLCNKDIIDHYQNLQPKDSPMQWTDQLRLGLANKDVNQWFEAASNLKDILRENINTKIALAAGFIIWNNKIVIDNSGYIFDGEEGPEFNELLYNLVDDREITTEMIAKWSKELFLICKALFQLKQFDDYDRLIAKVKHPKITNMLANYFYKVGLYELAFQYYSSLLSTNDLDVISLENLGLYMYNHGQHEDSIEFLREALRKDPKRRHLYYPLILQASGSIREEYIEKFKNEFDPFLSIKFIKKTFA
ncbi:hypothetical protein BK126_21240 [Paenibacillus sp. FSL H7-0326]|uniref:glycosyltransferase n=1 Tax=Paenibacillus sp. FSL H7-0326 TaxID=1921144 RepID=UPI00096EE826|nr:glycosyltransferase [Paenibacillus sp. FSL H7-0326]OMC66525.1 hypothetical protein BK126_21240 [Paenibacillus sp. FSL H7-0326]